MNRLDGLLDARAALVLRLVAAAAVAYGAYVHFHLWDAYSYRHTPVGDLFIANVVASFIAIVLLGVRRWWAPALIVAVSLGSLAAFAISHTVGLPTPSGVTFDESGLQPHGFAIGGVSGVLLMLIAEAVAAAAGIAIAVMTRAQASTVD